MRRFRTFIVASAFLLTSCGVPVGFTKKTSKVPSPPDKLQLSFTSPSVLKDIPRTQTLSKPPCQPTTFDSSTMPAVGTPIKTTINNRDVTIKTSSYPIAPYTLNEYTFADVVIKTPTVAPCETSVITLKKGIKTIATYTNIIPSQWSAYQGYKNRGWNVIPSVNRLILHHAVEENSILTEKISVIDLTTLKVVMTLPLDTCAENSWPEENGTISALVTDSVKRKTISCGFDSSGSYLFKVTTSDAIPYSIAPEIFSPKNSLALFIDSAHVLFPSGSGETLAYIVNYLNPTKWAAVKVQTKDIILNPSKYQIDISETSIQNPIVKVRTKLYNPPCYTYTCSSPFTWSDWQQL